MQENAGLETGPAYSNRNLLILTSTREAWETRKLPSEICSKFLQKMTKRRVRGGVGVTAWCETTPSWQTHKIDPAHFPFNF